MPRQHSRLPGLKTTSARPIVRAIAAYVDTLDLPALGFTNADGELTLGQPAFDPAVLLKLYLWV